MRKNKTEEQLRHFIKEWVRYLLFSLDREVKSGYTDFLTFKEAQNTSLNSIKITTLFDDRLKSINLLAFQAKEATSQKEFEHSLIKILDLLEGGL